MLSMYCSQVKTKAVDLTGCSEAIGSKWSGAPTPERPQSRARSGRYRSRSMSPYLSRRSTPYFCRPLLIHAPTLPSPDLIEPPPISTRLIAYEYSVENFLPGHFSFLPEMDWMAQR